MRVLDTHCRALYTCLLLASMLLGACSDKPGGTRLPDDAVILAFGDSITYGTGADEHQSYPAILANLSGHRVINAGIPGEVTAAGKRRLPALLDIYKPALLILCHGGNDILRRLNASDTESNLESMIDSARQRNIPVILIGVPAFGFLLLSADDMYDRIANKYALLYEGEILPRVESAAGLKSDRIHPNADGYREMAKAIHQLLQKNGVLD